MKLLSVLLLLAGSAFAQAEYVAYYDASLSAAASTVTVQAPASNAPRIARFVSVYLYCSVACDVTLERDGTAATTTALTPTPLTSVTPAAKTQAFRTSNVGTGTVITKYTLVAGVPQVISLASMALFGPGTGNNVTLRTSSITGIARIAVQFREDQ